MKIKTLLLIVATGCMAQQARSQMKMADVFKQIPDSLLPYLSKNNRLDMIDFMEAKMKAEVTNRLGGTSTMTSLGDDSLTITMSPSMHIAMHLVERDSIVVRLTKTYKISESQEESVVSYYSTSWLPLSPATVVSSTLLRRDEEIFARPHF